LRRGRTTAVRLLRFPSCWWGCDAGWQRPATTWMQRRTGRERRSAALSALGRWTPPGRRPPSAAASSPPVLNQHPRRVPRRHLPHAPESAAAAPFSLARPATGAASAAAEAPHHSLPAARRPLPAAGRPQRCRPARCGGYGGGGGAPRHHGAAFHYAALRSMSIGCFILLGENRERGGRREWRWLDRNGPGLENETSLADAVF